MRLRKEGTGVTEKETLHRRFAAVTDTFSPRWDEIGCDLDLLRLGWEMIHEHLGGVGGEGLARLGEGGGLLAFSIRRALSLRGSCRRLFCIHFHYCFFVCVFSKPREATCLLACTLLVSIVFIV